MKRLFFLAMLMLCLLPWAWGDQLFLTSHTSSSSSEKKEPVVVVEAPLLPVPDGESLMLDLVAKRTAELATEMQKQTPYTLEHVLDDIRRSTQCAESVEKQLRMLAAGAHTNEVDEAREAMLESFPQQVKQTEPENLRSKVAALRSPRSPQDALYTPFWKKGVQSVLPAEKLSQWEKVKEGRQVYRQQAVAKMTLALVQRSISMTQQQRDKLQLLLAEGIKSYAKELEYYEGRSDSVRLSVLTLYLLAVDEKKLRAELTAEQMKLWEKLPNEEMKETFRYIKQRREQRLKNPEGEDEEEEF